MNKSELINELSEKLPSYTKDEIEFFIKILTDVVRQGLEKDRIVRTHLGTFKIVTRKPRRIKSIHSGELTVLPAKDVIVFKPSKKLEDN